jgi:LPS-assembly protein
LAGLEYNAGCWAFRAVVHSFTTTTTQRSDSIFFQLELNGIGSIGSNPLDVLTRNIYGYIKTTQIPNENNTTEFR